MKGRKYRDYERGDLVKWFEYYADGEMVRDGGTGVVIDIRATSVKVFCTKKRHAQWFSVKDIDLIKKTVFINNGEINS